MSLALRPETKCVAIVSLLSEGTTTICMCDLASLGPHLPLLLWNRLLDLMFRRLLTAWMQPPFCVAELPTNVPVTPT